MFAVQMTKILKLVANVVPKTDQYLLYNSPVMQTDLSGGLL